MPGHRAPGVLVEHEGVPGRQQRAGERGHHDCVVDVGDDPEADARGDDEHRDGHRGGLLDGDLDPLPAGLEVRLDPHVEHAAAVGPHDVPPGSGGHDDLGVAHGNADEAAPAAQVGEAVGLGGVTLGEHDAAEHPHPAVAAVSGERDHRGDQATAAAAALAEGVEGILDPRWEVRDRTPPVLRGNH